MGVASRSVGFMFVVLAASGSSVYAAEDPLGPEARVNAKLDREMPNVLFKGNALGDVVDFLRDVGGFNAVVDWDVLATAGVKRTAPVTYAAQRVRISQVLTSVLDRVAGRPNRATFGVIGPAVVITTPADLALWKGGAARHSTAGEPEAIGRTLPEGRFQRAPLSAVLDRLHQNAGVTVRADWHALSTSGVEQGAPVTARLKGASLRDTLLLVLHTLGGKSPLDYRAEPDGSVTVSTVAALKPR